MIRQFMYFFMFLFMFFFYQQWVGYATLFKFLLITKHVILNNEIYSMLQGINTGVQLTSSRAVLSFCPG